MFPDLLSVMAEGDFGSPQDNHLDLPLASIQAKPSVLWAVKTLLVYLAMRA